MSDAVNQPCATGGRRTLRSRPSRPLRASGREPPDAIIWHDLECGAYTADLPLWRELAADAGGPMLELGAGTGRVALDLAKRGHEVIALDSDPALLDELDRRAAARGLEVRCLRGDARRFGPLDRADPRQPEGGAQADGGPPERFALVLAPMQLAQILGGPDDRAGMLERVRAHLLLGGVFAAALADTAAAIAPEDPSPPWPDVAERDGWVFSSLPLDVRPEPGGAAVERLRQLVSPAGELSEERHTVVLDSVTPDQLERETAAVGLRPIGRREIGPTEDHVGSVVVVARAP